jgi:hypothetical protein
MRSLIVKLTAFLSALTTVFGLKNKVYKVRKQTIGFSTVDGIKIHNSAQVVQYLTSEQVKLFVEKWNNSKPKGLCKYIVLFWIDLTFKDGRTRKFRVNKKFIKEDNDCCFDLGDDKYLERLWPELNDQHTQGS